MDCLDIDAEAREHLDDIMSAWLVRVPGREAAVALRESTFAPEACPPDVKLPLMPAELEP